ncbi:hypothetical protein [Parapedobacter sp. DT-150]|uniref:hypothetical protein n=1 Tax=Parapedobacter sp. DT-150 TaxID=3396162 RepID=UPI003F1CEA6B
MKHHTIRQASLKVFALVAVCFIAFGFTSIVGLDSYSIYLNNKLILKQYVNQPLNLRKLQLHKANEQDQLRIFYTHCNQEGAGTGRSIAIKDQRGNILKKWDFADTKGTDEGMVISVKALTQLEKDHADRTLSLHYAADELPNGELLAALQLD